MESIFEDNEGIKTDMIKRSINSATIEDGIPFLGVQVRKDQAFASSRKVAKIFDKRHSDVLRAIENIIAMDEEWAERNIALSKYKDKSGKRNKLYLLNRKSFPMVVVGFTGKKAFEFKKLYIEAYEQMRELIMSRLISKDGYKIMTSNIKYYLRPQKKDRYAKEADMINKIVLGTDAKTFRELNDIENRSSTRDSVVGRKLQELDEAQRMNARLIKAGMTFSSRKRIIEASF